MKANNETNQPTELKSVVLGLEWERDQHEQLRARLLDLWEQWRRRLAELDEQIDQCDISTSTGGMEAARLMGKRTMVRSMAAELLREIKQDNKRQLAKTKKQSSRAS